MNLFQVLQTLDPSLDPSDCKLHLACWNGHEHPIDEYLEGRFEEWQSWQRRQNFGRALVVSLVDKGNSRWLFAGVYRTLGVRFAEAEDLYRYRTERCAAFDEVDGRVIVEFKRPGRNSYLVGEKWADALTVVEIKEKREAIAEFPGYAAATLTMPELRVVVSQGIESWRAALSAVAGVYVIADRGTGLLYVGSATGTAGIWGRWCSYASTGHGGNKELRALLRDQGVEHAEQFQFGVLEIADTHASADDVLRRETHWKNLLLSRAPFGLNAN